MRIKSKLLIFVCLVTGLAYSCIGTDIINDLVEERITMINMVEALIVGDSFQFEAAYFDNTGLKQPVQIQWTSSDQEVLEINENGFATAIGPGSAEVTSSVNSLSSSVTVMVFDPAEVDEDSIRMQQMQQEARTAVLQTVSSYKLDGTATLEAQNGGLQLVFSDDFATTSALPGLYVYLTNNTSTINNALEIGEVKQFTGSQVYDVPGNVRLQDFSHVLFYCKPFVVPVGNGKFEP